MARGSKQQFSASGIKRPDYGIIQAGMKKAKIDNINRDYDRLMQDALWYVHYEVDAKTLAKEFIAYADKQLKADKESIRKLKLVSPFHMQVPGKYAYIANKGAQLSEDHQLMLQEQYRDIMQRADDTDAAAEADEIATEDKPAKKNVISIQDRMWDQVAELIGDLESKLDLFLDGEFEMRKFDPYRALMAHQPEVKPAHAKLIRSHFEPGFEEAKLVLEFKDPEIKEAYSQFTARTQVRKNYLKFFEDIITACDTIINTGKSQRKTRVKKAPDKAKMVSKLKYKESEPALGLASINPVSIMDKSTLWVYNTKNRKLIRYVADEMIGTLGIKGTTIVGYDEAKTQQKTVRKPEQLKGANKLSRTKMDKLYTELTTTETKANGRINEHCVLINVF